MSNIFKPFIINNEIIVDERNWSMIKSVYSEDLIIKHISDAIVLFDIKLPYREISFDEMVTDFKELCDLYTPNLLKMGDWGSKFTYDHHFTPNYIDLSGVGNKSSDYFHQVERWKCDATGYPSPQKTWETERFRLTLFKALFSLKVKEINPQVLRSIISLRKYIAAQFRPSTAKTIYELFNGGSVLDLSMGWGDRIAGAAASNCVRRYVGIDPNINLINGYMKQIVQYNTLSKKQVDYQLHCGCAEDENLDLGDEMFDLIFTSPPYFDKEKYDQSDQQSYVKYKGFESWMRDFLCKMIEIRMLNLRSGGYLVINISDIYTRKKQYKICNEMNNFIINTNQFKYLGAIGLRMPKRPQSISSDTVGIYGEPIWCYYKI